MKSCDVDLKVLPGVECNGYNCYCPWVTLIACISKKTGIHVQVVRSIYEPSDGKRVLLACLGENELSPPRSSALYTGSFAENRD